jgi:hypothetical protein
VKVFENLPGNLKVGEKAQDFSISNDLSMSSLKGYPIFLVFWKTL